MQEDSSWRRNRQTLACDSVSRHRKVERSVCGNISFQFGTMFGGFGMNRVFVFGVAVFFAIVGIALLGGEKQAVAGHGCNGCHGAVACDGAASCCAPAACSGRARMACSGRARRSGCAGMHHRRARRRCCGQPVACCGQPTTCCGTVVDSCCQTVTEAAPESAPTKPRRKLRRKTNLAKPLLRKLRPTPASSSERVLPQ